MRLVRVGVTAAAVMWVLGQVDPDRVGAALTSVPLWVFGVPALAVALNTAIQAHRLRLLLGGLGAPLPISRLVGVICRGAFAGLALPQGGAEVVKAALLSWTPVGVDRALSAMLMARFTQLPVTAMFLLWAALSGSLSHHPSLVAVALAYAAGTAAVWWVMLRGIRVPRWLPQSFADRASGVQGALAILRGRTGLVPVCMAWALPTVAVNCAVVWLLLDRFGHSFSFADMLALVPAMDAVIWLPISVGGIGVRETVFAVVLEPHGVLVDAAIAVGVVRWTGELARAGIGCMLWLLAATVRPGSGSGTFAEGNQND